MSPDDLAIALATQDIKAATINRINLGPRYYP